MTAEDAGREGLTGRKKANRWRISRRKRLSFPPLSSVDAVLNEAGKEEEGGEKKEPPTPLTGGALACPDCFVYLLI